MNEQKTSGRRPGESRDPDKSTHWIPAFAGTTYPWQQSQWQQLFAAHQANRLPHALLFTGIAGTGKSQFADIFANALLCTSPNNNMPCGNCHACHMLAGNAHPNKITIAPEKAGAAIKVDQVREIAEFTQQTALIGERRIVIIQQADAMNISAANALLKTLEEPAAGALLILVSEQGGQLPATIISRCQRILFPRPPHEAALTWLRAQIKSSAIAPEQLLAIANGAPLKALQLTEEHALAGRNLLFDTLCQMKEINPVAAAAQLEKMELVELIDYFLSFLMDLLHVKLNATININKDYQQQMVALQEKINTDNCIHLMQLLQQVRRQVLVGVNFNRQLIVESLLMRWRGQVA